MEKGAELDVDLDLVVEVLLDALAGGADDAEGVGLVDHEEGVVGVADLAQVDQGGDVAVHGVDAVDDDEADAGVGGGGQAALEVGDVVVAEAGDGGAGELAAVDDAGVVVLVDEDGVAGADDGADGADVGGVAGAEDQGAFAAGDLGDLGLQLLVQGGGAGQGAHPVVAGAVAVDGGLGGGDDPLVAGEAEVGVAGHHQQAAAVLVGVGGVPLGGVGHEAVLAVGLVLQGPDAVAEVGQLRLEPLPCFGCVHVFLLVAIVRRRQNLPSAPRRFSGRALVEFH